MNYIFGILILVFATNSRVIFDFSKTSKLSNWYVVDDVVMGGRSSGSFVLNNEGHGVFSGEVSLENNGGFSSVRYRFDKMKVSEKDRVVIKLKGDGKDYQFRVKANSRDYYSFIKTFETNGEWQEVVLSLKDMYPSFRGRKLDMPNFSGNYIEEVTFLIGNKKPQTFKLLIDKIELQ